MNDSDKAVQDMLAKLGFRFTSPLQERNVRTALAFFQRRMPSLKEDSKLGYLRGMDLHREVQEEWLHSGVEVAAFRRAGEPLFKLFYTKPGTSPFHLGIVPNDRAFHRFRVQWSVQVLASRAGSYVYASAGDAAPGQRSWALPGGGGGQQYIIPNADQFLDEILNPVKES